MTPRVSIVIPAYYSDSTIADSLGALRQQTFRDFEVIVVNSSPEDHTRQIVEQGFGEVAFEQVQHRLLPHAARNRGAERARGDVFVFTDPDCRAHPEWLERLVHAHDAGHPFVGGAIEPAEHTWFARGVHVCKYSFRLSGLRAGPCWIAGTANACCSREVWQTIGPFDGGHFAGDAIFSWHATARGWQPWFEPTAVVEHRYVGSTRSLWQERVTRGEDFADARMEFEEWSRPRAAAYALGLPVALPLVLARGGRDAFRVKWGMTFLSTLPLQVIGHAAWSIGEARAHWRAAIGKS
jgi:glycosyltransferase involved in cell wall biosynthesis